MKKFLVTLTIIITVLSVIVITNTVLDASITTTNYVVRSTKIPKGFDNYKIALITDYHNAEFSDQAIDIIHDMNPDIIFFVGDMINVTDTYDSVRHTETLISGIRDVAPIYMVSGNHEIFNPRWKGKIDEKFINLGVNIIDIQGINIMRGHDYIHVYGMQDPAVSDEELLAGSWTDEWADVAGRDYDASKFNILLCHRANYFDKLSQYKYELVLAGHMHGGLWRLPWIGGVFSPDRKTLFPNYTAGSYMKNGTQMIVSRGCDKDKNRMRMFNQPEIVKITLRSDK